MPLNFPLAAHTRQTGTRASLAFVWGGAADERRGAASALSQLLRAQSAGAGARAPGRLGRLGAHLGL